MARKLRGLERVLGPSSIASVAYAEIGSSVYFALGIVALYALGLTPWVLLGVGLVILLVTVSYAEASSALPETGGAALFVARAFNDPVGFLTGWVLFLDYLIVIALAGLFVPHYVGAALGWEGITREPWDGILGVCVILGVVGFRLVRRAELYRIAVAVAALALLTHLLLIVLGLGFVFSPSDLTDVDLGTAPAWGDLAFALALATLAYTGLETVANLAAEAREPGKTLPRSLFAGIGLVVLVTAAIGLVSVSVPSVQEELEAPLVAVVDALEGQLPAWSVDALRVFVGLGAVVVLVSAITTAISGTGRLAYALGRHDMLPHTFARLNRRTLLAPAAIVSAAVLASALLLVVDAAGRDVRFFGSLYSFGILLALTAAQLAVVRLRFTEPGLHRPYRAPGNVTLRGVQVPLLAVVGGVLTFALWIVALATHEAARVVGPLWLLLGVAVYVAVRRAGSESVLGTVVPADPDLVPEVPAEHRRVLVPVKIGPIGEEVLATALKLAEEVNGHVSVLHVLRVPFDKALDAELPAAEALAEASIAEAKDVAQEQGIELEGRIVRARALGEAIVEAAAEERADLIVMGSAPRWRRQSQFFSPTVDYVLRKAPCDVMVVAYPQGVLEEDEGITVAP
ncbi:MAG TPA: universal stress protein [Gaiellaceae bacterium]|nr:universal stress protein [Gaiellaceae bacterium]